jgi:hypothetical protein
MPVSRVSVAACLLAATAGACTVGAPPGFSSGDSWAFPLVGPLEDGALLVPASVNGRGPFLFLVDPDAMVSSIDEALASGLDLYGGLGPRLTDESDTERPTRVVEVGELELGNLTVSRRSLLVHAHGAFAAAGRELAGVLGRDIIAESLVFAFDRDAGMGYLATREVFTAPEPAIAIKFKDVALRTGLVEVTAASRRLVTAQVNGAAQSLHVDLGAAQSQLRAGRWAAAHLTPLPFRTTLVDELGTPRTIDRAGIANQVTVGAASSMGVLMAPYDDRRTDPEAIDGTLGLNFFAPYAVWADWSGRTIYLRTRDHDDDKLPLRLARWTSSVLAACAEPACVKASRVESASPAPAPPPTDDGEPALPAVEVEVVRDGSAAAMIYEVTLEAIGDDGRPLGLPRLIATLPRGATTVRQKVSPVFADAHFRVVDVSPFVRICRQAGGCIFELAVAR